MVLKKALSTCKQAWSAAFKLCLRAIFSSLKGLYFQPWVWLPSIFFGLDQAMKSLASRKLGQSFLLWKLLGVGFGVTGVKNYGIGGGYFQQLHSHNLLCLQLGAGFIWFMSRQGSRSRDCWGFSWFFWGCLSNIWDRMRWQFIMDYLSLALLDGRGQACLSLQFNLADLMIILGIFRALWSDHRLSNG